MSNLRALLGTHGSFFYRENGLRHRGSLLLSSRLSIEHSNIRVTPFSRMCENTCTSGNGFIHADPFPVKTYQRPSFTINIDAGSMARGLLYHTGLDVLSLEYELPCSIEMHSSSQGWM